MAKQAPIMESVEPEFFIDVDRSETIRVALVGALVGILTPLLAWLISNFFVNAIFCRTADAFTFCATSDNLAFNLTAVLLALVATVALARLRVFRPLLITVASVAALWGLKRYLDGMLVSPWEFYTWFVLLYTLSYLTFYWLLRMRNFVVSLIAVVLVVILVRWVLIVG